MQRRAFSLQTAGAATNACGNVERPTQLLPTAEAGCAAGRQPAVAGGGSAAEAPQPCFCPRCCPVLRSRVPSCYQLHLRR